MGVIFGGVAREGVGVNAEDGVALCRAGVEDEAEVAVWPLGGQGVREPDQFGQQPGVTGSEFDDVAVFARLGDDQEMHGGLGGDVANRERVLGLRDDLPRDLALEDARERSEEHMSELQSLMRISYAVFCLKKKKK